MTRPLPVKSCAKGGCKDPKFLLFTGRSPVSQSMVMRRSQILRSPQQRRLGCGSNGKVPLGYGNMGEPLKDASGATLYRKGCTRNLAGTVYTSPQLVNGFGRGMGQSGCLNNPQKGGMVISNF